jgi:hypothetical protein
MRLPAVVLGTRHHTPLELKVSVEALRAAQRVHAASPRLLGIFLPRPMRQKRDADSEPANLRPPGNYSRGRCIIRLVSDTRAPQWIYWTSFENTPANVERWRNKRGPRRIGRPGNIWPSGGCVARRSSRATAWHPVPIRRACIGTANARPGGCTTKASRSGRDFVKPCDQTLAVRRVFLCRRRSVNAGSLVYLDALSV